MFDVGLNATTVSSIRFVRKGEVWDTFVPENNNYLMSGVPHAQSGKSAATFVEDAWAATGTHPIEGKYPKENGTLVIVGANWKHIGMVVVPFLFKAGAFRIIRDLVTGRWRAFDPLADAGRKGETKPAPPLIPPRLIKSKNWLSLSAGYLNMCELHNGWVIHCFSSDGEPPRGFPADRVHIDEDIQNEEWVPEMQSRLADRKGRFTWSAMPQTKNDALVGLNDRATKAEETGDTKDIRRFVFRFLDNPYIDDDEKRKMLERWSAQGENVVRQRSEGEFATPSYLVYPGFNMMVHGMDPKELPNRVVPADWCRYAVVDPGHSVAAVLFAAVPPDQSKILLYDELYIRNCDAVMFAEEFGKKTQGQSFYAFLIDIHGGRYTEMGSGRSAQEQYTEQLAKRGIVSEATGSSFIPGCDNVQAGLHAVRNIMHIMPEGTSRFRVLQGYLPNLERELRYYKKKIEYVAGAAIVKDEPNKRGDFHLVDCLRYLCAYEPKYHKPSAKIVDPWWVKWAAEKDRGARQQGISLAPASCSEVWYA